MVPPVEEVMLMWATVMPVHPAAWLHLNVTALSVADDPWNPVYVMSLMLRSYRRYSNRQESGLDIASCFSLIQHNGRSCFSDSYILGGIVKLVDHNGILRCLQSYVLERDLPDISRAPLQIDNTRRKAGSAGSVSSR